MNRTSNRKKLRALLQLTGQPGFGKRPIPLHGLFRSLQEGGDFLDIFLSDPSLCRLYLGFSKLDPETAESLRKTVAMPRLKAYAHVLDFFGAMFEIRNGKAVAPGCFFGVDCVVLKKP